MRHRTTLTARGFALLVSGILATAGAAFLGELDLIWLGITIAMLPVIAFTYLIVAKPQISYQRLLQPATIPVGSSSRVILDAVNNSPAQGGSLRLVDTAPAELGDGASFMIARGFGQWRQAVGYSMQAQQRGRFRIGPLTCTTSDPLALARRSHTAVGDYNTLRVTPRVWPLEDLSGGAGMGSASDATPQKIGQAGQDDVLVRDHRYGDDIRRVHWKSSAKQGELMVRLEEHPWDPSSTLIIDNRSAAHLGSGPTGSFEWAVSAVTSAAALMLAGRNRVAILAPSGTIFEPGHLAGNSARNTMLEAMTDLSASGQERLTISAEETLSVTASLIAATGVLTPADAVGLATAGSRARRHIALVPDCQAWGAPNPEHEQACSVLRSYGWQVATYAPTEPVPEVWSKVA